MATIHKGTRPQVAWNELSSMIAGPQHNTKMTNSIIVPQRPQPTTPQGTTQQLNLHEINKATYPHFNRTKNLIRNCSTKTKKNKLNSK